KPANILLQDGHAVVADFGIARALGEAGGSLLTRTGVTLGTPQYMSPEQITGDRPIDGRTDVYALGCVLYEMLAGKPPFAGPSVQAMVARRLAEPPPRLVTTGSGLPAEVDQAVQDRKSTRLN